MAASGKPSTTSRALEAAGDAEAARDIGALDSAASGADRKLAPTRRGLVERLIYGPAPGADELRAGGLMAAELTRMGHEVVDAALNVLATGEAFRVAGDPELDQLGALWTCELTIVD